MKVFALTLALLAAACAPLPFPVAGAGPSDPSSPVPPVRHRAVLGDYSSQRPVEPGDWRQQNERVAPQPKR